MKKTLYLSILAVLLVSCGTQSKLTKNDAYPKIYEEKPVTLLVMPPINKTSNVVSKDFLYTSISRPLIESGYYVISPFLAMDILKAESAYDSELFVEGPLGKFRDFFGVDAVVFSEINSWTKLGFGINTNIRYFIKSAKTGEILFEHDCDLYLDLSVNSGSNSLLGSLIDIAASAVNTATTEHIEAARNVNYLVFSDLPDGKYGARYMQDGADSANKKEFKTTVR